MERVEGRSRLPHFIKVLCEVQTTRARNPTLRLLSLWGFLVESLMPLCKRGQDKWRKKGGKRQTPLPRPVRPSVRPSGFRFHGRRRTPVSSHIKYYKTNRRRISATDPPSLCMATLKGWEGGEGEGRLSQILFKVFLRLHIQVARCLQVAEEYL